MRYRFWLPLSLLLILAVLVGCWWLARPPAPQLTPQVAGRQAHTATLLADGTILVVGGRGERGGTTDVAERFDPRTGLWHDAGRLRAARLRHTASLMPDGSVIVVGGDGANPPLLGPLLGTILGTTLAGIATVERYDPATNRWSALAPLPQGVTRHSAVVLGDGRLLVAGGVRDNGALARPLTAAWAYDPARDRWAALAPLNLSRSGSAGVALPDGRAMLVGGSEIGALSASRSAETYDAGTDSWQLVADLPARLLDTPQFARLADGRFLFVIYDAAALYDPGRQRWSAAAPPPQPTANGTLTALPDGRALLIAFQWQDVYDPAQDRWQSGTPTIWRFWHTATLLPDGRVVLLGGQSVERYGAGHDAEFVQP